MPPNALAYKLQDPQWRLRQAGAIGPACRALIERLFSSRVLDNLRAAQGIVALGKPYGTTRRESACRRALHFDNPRYRAVKEIRKQGLDQVPPEEAPSALSEVYTLQSRFLRGAGEQQLH